ncbi:hypothetical protein KY332_00805 [Candidatus Woesearchaeota archaeon]|nr:hypothetical protein [Candidatus Woesearchaeota archaeon]
MKEERKRLIVSLFIVFIMVTSVIGYMFGKDGGEKVDYNDYSFLRKGREWTVRVDGKELNFNFFPAEVENINISFDLGLLKNKVEIDTTSDLEDKYAEAIALAQYQMQGSLAKISNTYVLIGLTDENEFNMPVIDCEDASAFVPVIYFKESNITKIDEVNSCIIVEAKNEMDILRIKDRIVYEMVGIIR